MIKKLYCVTCSKYRKLEKPKTYLLEKALVFSIICNKCKNKDEKIFKEEELIEILKFIGLTENVLLLSEYGWTKHKPRI